MKKIFLLPLLMLGLIACQKAEQTSPKEHAHAETLRDAMGEHFFVGCAVCAETVRDVNGKAHAVVANQFNSIVAENCMKPESLSPAEGVWSWEDADAFVAMGEEQGKVIMGHTLVWHSQAARWMFTDEDGNPASRELLIERMREYIHTVVGRYKGRVYGWDVCNECFNDDGTWRESEWYRIIGEDFIALAFQFAHEADPEAELYYNDYSLSKQPKYEAVCRLVRDLKARGLRIDAVGMQSHHGLYWPKLVDYEQAMNAIAATGVMINVSELDLNVLPTPEEFGGAEVSQNFQYSAEMDPYADGLDVRNAGIIDERWQSLFMLYREHAHQIKRVCVWGVGDGDSWLNNWPIPGRHAYGLLFDRDYEPKPVVNDIIRIFE